MHPISLEEVSFLCFIKVLLQCMSRFLTTFKFNPQALPGCHSPHSHCTHTELKYVHKVCVGVAKVWGVSFHKHIRHGLAWFTLSFLKIYLLICCLSVLPACVSMPCMHVYALHVYLCPAYMQCWRQKSEELPNSYISLCRHGELAYLFMRSNHTYHKAHHPPTLMCMWQ